MARHLGARLAAEMMGVLRSRQVPDLQRLFEAQGVELSRRELPPNMTLRANLEGTTLVDLDPAGMAWRVGLRAGDKLLRVGDLAPKSAEELRAAWGSQRERVRVRFERDGQEHSIDAPLENVVVFELGESPWTF